MGVFDLLVGLANDQGDYGKSLTGRGGAHEEMESCGFTNHSGLGKIIASIYP
jgi:hypothetical protein